MAELQRITNTLPKTGTHVIRFVNDKKLMSKVVIPGAKNSNPKRIKKMITNYENQKPSEIRIQYYNYLDAMGHYADLKNLKNKWK